MKLPAAAQAALTAEILASMGVPARETFEVHRPGNAFVHGRIVGFDAAQFADAAPHEALSELALRSRETSPPDAVRRFIAPDVPANCGRFVEYALYHDGDDLPSMDNPVDERRAMEVDFPTLRNPPHQLVTQRIADCGLSVEVDEDAERLDADWKQTRVTFLRDVIDRARLRRTAARFVAGAVRVGKTWNATADPDMDVMDELDAQSLRASRIAYVPGAWSRRDRALRARDTAGGGSSAGFSPQELAGELAVEEVRILPAETAPAGDDAAGGQVLLFCAADRLSRNDFSNLKTFTAPARNGARYAAYAHRVGARRWRLAVECCETVAITSTVGLEVISVS